jgi:hypothetical protein
MRSPNNNYIYIYIYRERERERERERAIVGKKLWINPKNNIMTPLHNSMDEDLKP